MQQLTWFVNGHEITKPEIRTIAPGDLIGRLVLLNTYGRELQKVQVFDEGGKAEFQRRAGQPWHDKLLLGTVRPGQRVGFWARSHGRPTVVLGYSIGCIEGPTQIHIQELP